MGGVRVGGVRVRRDGEWGGCVYDGDASRGVHV